MALDKANAAPCWVATMPPEGDELHLPTRAEAIADAVKMGPGAQVRRMLVCCYLATCDRCGAAEGDSESTGGFHLPAEEPAHVLPWLGDLEQVGTELLCSWCRPVDPITSLTVSPALAALVLGVGR